MDDLEGKRIQAETSKLVAEAESLKRSKGLVKTLSPLLLGLLAIFGSWTQYTRSTIENERAAIEAKNDEFEANKNLFDTRIILEKKSVELQERKRELSLKVSEIASKGTQLRLLEGKLSSIATEINEKNNALNEADTEINNLILALKAEAVSAGISTSRFDELLSSTKGYKVQGLGKEISAVVEEIREAGRVDLKGSHTSSRDKTLALNLTNTAKQSFAESGFSPDDSVNQADGAIVISLGSGNLFNVGSALLSAQGQEKVSLLSDIFSQFPEYQIQVEGHTDNIPVGPALKLKYQSNWELSAARAAAVVSHLEDIGEINPIRLTAVGLGDSNPLAENDTAEGRKRNRRVEFLLSRN